MRAYLAVLPTQIESLLKAGSFSFNSAFATTRLFFEENSEVDEEEREFELSLLAAQESRNLQESDQALGFVLAVNLTSKQSGDESDYQVALLSDISWDQVDAALIAESDEAELTWYASQEIAEHLPTWLAE